MKIIKEAVAGTLESNDLQVKVTPNQTLEIIVNSEVIKQFGDQIKAVVNETIQKLGLANGLILIEDKGALDCTIRARVQSAILRGTEIEELEWSRL